MCNADIKVKGQNDGPDVGTHCGQCHNVAMNFTDILKYATSIPIWLNRDYHYCSQKIMVCYNNNAIVYVQRVPV